MDSNKYNALMTSISDNQPITQKDVDDLKALADQCNLKFKELKRQGRLAEAYWFRENRGDIRYALAHATVLAD